ncbi:ATP/GTP-binding protein [Rhodococcus sp. BP-149]|nr:ATP/GTP-binding protein [Rhodococcus sp. BP-288]MBY6696507.1 ATP/GTP-binding protein [Rhodococcus sp. BP-188]MBY6700588.1 ATP/GTP-binding protein [Rhodococcus sp. BP-285]MBY6704389.1 ATP/GTP-binding protein [Rhodococcus sp. BP-283]MBY6713713.1 ATP/GTP-binding protein [Rhodococcus sp. BP-160]MBY6717865.1 ATP/GTP-binding protein [Rhodococcus sp. BP-110]MBY6722256.1 ATP/GTP-binding protein [Rhodococcus sp. BP-142]MBY6726261.1 ATP/GTP-binding protein [Rhodococcus sp. BP-149]MBY6730477.1 ATP/
MLPRGVRWVVADVDYAALAERIAAGDEDEPATWTRTGIGLARWRNAGGRASGEVTGDPWWRSSTRSTARGHIGAGGGRMLAVPAAIEYEASSVQVCGFNPWAIGAAAPASGTIVGQHDVTGEALSCDPFAYFRDNHIANPSMFVLSLPGLGKSSLIRKILLGAIAWGQTPIVAGDIKAEYVKLARLVGGQVVTLGHGGGHLNPLAAGTLGQSVVRIRRARVAAAAAGDHARASMLDELIGTAELTVRTRQVNAVCALVELIRYDTHSVKAFENSLIGTALGELYSDGSEFSYQHPPLLRDLYARIDAGSAAMMQATYQTTREGYRAQITELMQALGALISGPLGDIFADHTSEPLDLDAPMIVIDVSSLDRGDTTLKAAVMLSCWADAYGTVEAAHLLADAGLEKQRLFLLALDELWQVIGAGPGMVARVNEISRLNRTDGAGLLMITHTGRDLETLPTEADIKTAKGFIDRAGMVVCGGLPIGEVERLSGELKFTPAEAGMVTSWSRGAALRSAERKSVRAPIGRGKFLIKVAKDNTPGIPIRTVFTDVEIDTGVHDTNARFAEYFDRGRHAVSADTVVDSAPQDI